MIDGELIKSKHKRQFIAQRLLAELNDTETAQLITTLFQAPLYDLNLRLIVPLLKRNIQSLSYKVKFQIMRLLVAASFLNKKIAHQKTEILQIKVKIIQYELKLKYEQIQIALSNTRADHMMQYRQIKQIADLSLNQTQSALWQNQQRLDDVLTQIKTQLMSLPPDLLNLLAIYHAEQHPVTSLLGKALGKKWANILISLHTNFDIFAPFTHATWQKRAPPPKMQKRIKSVFAKNHIFYETKCLSLLEKSMRMQRLCAALSPKMPLFLQIQSQIADITKQIKKKMLDPNLSKQTLNHLVFESREKLNILCQQFVNARFEDLTPLQWLILKAPKPGKATLVQYLLELGADPLLTTSSYKSVFFLPARPKTAYDLARTTKQKEIMALCKRYENKTAIIAPSPFVYHWQKVVTESLEHLRSQTNIDATTQHSIKALLAVQHYLNSNPDMMQERNEKSDILRKMITKLLRQEGPFTQGIDELLNRLKNRCHKECKILHSPYVKTV